MTIKIQDKITPSLERIQKQLETVMPRAYQYFRSITPKDTGRAQSRTQLKGSTIHANYAYADRLDQGYSRQAPQGMTKPTDEFIKNLTDKIIRK